MSSRKLGYTQPASALRAGFSERSGREIESGRRRICKVREWRTRKDPFYEAWDAEIEPMLKSQSGLSPTTLLGYLQDKYGVERYPDKLLRTMQRRVKEWKALHGESKEVMFLQRHRPGDLGLSDFTQLKQVQITINGKPFKHLLYHFRLIFSKWSYLKVIVGKESYTALAEGFQEALWRLGGSPQEHRTDSLSAAYKNLSKDEKEDITERYEALCRHYNIRASRNNRGKGHENGGVEAAHGHLKRRIRQALLLRGSCDFPCIEAYQAWLDEIVRQFNNRNCEALKIERKHLQKLPIRKTVDFTESVAVVSSTSTIRVKQKTYTVPSRLRGEKLRVHVYHDRLECYLGSVHVETLSRVCGTQSRRVDYRHVIDSLARKPQAFRYSQIRDDLLPNEQYKAIWEHANAVLSAKRACKFIVGLLHLAAQTGRELELGERVHRSIKQNGLISIAALRSEYLQKIAVPILEVEQHTLKSYDVLLGGCA